MSTPLSTRFLFFAILILLGWALSLFYGFVNQVIPPGWLSIAVLHSVLAWVLWRFARQLRDTVRLGALAFLPAAVVLGGSLIGGLLSRTWIAGAPPLDPRWDWDLVAFVLWIPVVEEFVFRFGIGGWARQKLGDFWGSYGSALVFAMAHGSGAWDQLTMPMGPLLLGLCCEWLYVTSGRLTAAMALHAACNASGWIFATLDERWLDWLQALYLKV
jgi:membrane protease YdiL (CAAX protease family)